MVENALKCLKNAFDDVRATYTQALLAYVFTLSSDSDLRKRVLEILDGVSIKKGNAILCKLHHQIMIIYTILRLWWSLVCYLTILVIMFVST